MSKYLTTFILLFNLAQAQINLPLPLFLPANDTVYRQDFNITPGSSGIFYPWGWGGYANGTYSPILGLPNMQAVPSVFLINYGSKVGMIGGTGWQDCSTVMAIFNTSNRSGFRISYRVTRESNSWFSINKLQLEYSTTSPTSGFQPVPNTTYYSFFLTPSRNFVNVPLPGLTDQHSIVYLRWKYGNTILSLLGADGIAIDDVELKWKIGVPPTPPLPPTATICTGSSLTLDALNPGATYLWSTGDTTKTITISSPGQYSVTVTNSAGTVSDTIQVKQVPLPNSELTHGSIFWGIPHNGTADQPDEICVGNLVAYRISPP
ncbi:MAG: hypothetical protein NZ108_07185, partial [Bacteroidia bacterium]|nr:hypothetical protein [Bacteroidia bacterium]